VLHQNTLEAERDRVARIRITAQAEAEARHEEMEQEAFATEVEMHRMVDQESTALESAAAEALKTKVLDRQAAQRSTRIEQERLQATRSFNAKWKGASNRASDAAREKTAAWLVSEPGKEWLEDESKTFAATKNVEDLRQDGSDYRIEERFLGRLWAVHS